MTSASRRLRAGGRIAAACALAASLALAGGCRAPEAAEPETAEVVPARDAGRPTLLLTGELAAVREHRALVPREAAWRHPIRWIEEEGTRVKAGQRVVEFDNASATSAIEEAGLRLDEALNTLVTAHADGNARLAEKELELARKTTAHRKAALAADVPQGLLAEREHQDRRLALREAEAALEKAEQDLAATRTEVEAELANARLAVEKAERDLETAERALERLVLLAPEDGILLVNDHPWEGRPLQVGDSIFAGWPVVSIPDRSDMKVEAWLSDVDDGRVEPGMQTEVVLDTHPGRTFTGIVSDVAPVAVAEDRGSLRRGFRVTVTLDETDPALMIPGMSARVEVLTGAAS